MITGRRSLLALGAALPFLGAAAPPNAAVDLAMAWRRLFAGPPGETFAWWFQGTFFAHVDGLREFPVLAQHAVMICRTEAAADATRLDFRVIGFFADLESGLPTHSWDNAFTGAREPIPPLYREGPGRYVMTPQADGAATVSLTSPSVRANRVVVTGETRDGCVLLTQAEGTLQGFPRLDGALPALSDPTVTERQTRLQLVSPIGAATGTRGFFTQVYDALPPWMGFGERLGSGLSKGVLRRGRADEIVNAQAWAYLKSHAPRSFVGRRLALA